MCILCMSLHIDCIQWALTLRLSCCIPLESGGMYRLSLFTSLIVTFYKNIITRNLHSTCLLSAMLLCIALVSDFISIKLNLFQIYNFAQFASIQNPTNLAHESSIKVKHL